MLDPILEPLKDYAAQIRFFVEAVAVIALLQFLVITICGSIIAWNVHKIAETFERSTPRSNDSQFPAPVAQRQP